MLRFDLAFLKEGLDTIIFKNKVFALRPYPLIYWLSHDAEYLQTYKTAIDGTRAEYYKAVHEI